MIRRPSLTALYAAAAIGCVPLPYLASAQNVRVRIVDRDTREALAGALVTALGTGGETLARTVSDELGRGLLVLRPSAVVRLRAERVGFAAGLSDTFTVTASLPTTEIALSTRSLVLPTIDVKSGSRCGPAGQSPGAATLWDEVRKALASAEYAARHRPTLSGGRYVRTLDRSLTVIAETSAVSQGPGFISAPSADLSRLGFVRRIDDTPVFYAPDVALLLSREFVQDHCFGIVERDPLVGLTFEPVPGRPVPDVAGVLWVERQTSQLRWLEYRYTGATSSTDSLVGGRLDFELLPTGEWIIAQWHIRLPRLALIRSSRVGSFETAQRDTLLGYREEGGWISAQSLSEGRGGSVHGVTFDSLSNAPLSGVRVALGDAAVTFTDSAGTYRLDLPLAGRFKLSFSHPRLEIGGSASVSRDVVVGRGEAVRLDVASPGIQTLQGRLCGNTANRADNARPILLVTLRDSASGAPLRESAVAVTWRATSFRSSATGTMAGTADSSLVGEPDQHGQVGFCLPAAGDRVAVTVQHGSRTARRNVPVAPGAIVLEHAFELGADGAGTGRLDLLVVSGQEPRRGIPAAEVLIPSLLRSARAGPDGSVTFSRVTDGVHTLIVRAIGYSPATLRVTMPRTTGAVPVQLNPLPATLAPVLVLGEAAVTGRLRAFEERRAAIAGATFIDNAVLAKQENRNLSDVLRSVRGVRIINRRDGTKVLASSRKSQLRSLGADRMCPFQVYLDGMRIYSPTDPQAVVPDIDDFAVRGIAAIEIYGGPATTPPQFSGASAECGTVVLWTRDR
ncbi:MAG: TonB-dependent receptor plug domain-containing protein [Gemmatimonadota bacterium]